MRWAVCSVLAGLMAATPVWAEDYKPVTCAAAKPYAGVAPHPYDLKPMFGLAPVPAADLDAAAVGRLHAAFATARDKTRAVAINAAVGVPGKGQWQENTVPAGQLYAWASAGKTFTAVAILQLAEEGSLSLSDPVSKWIDGVPNGKVITIRHLLTHTSGLFSANEDLVFHKSPHPMTLDEDLKIVRRHGAMFCPGENWRYSNSGYALLGAVLEKIEQKPYAQIIKARIIDKLGLSDTRVVTPDDTLAGIVPPQSQTAEPAIDPRQPGAAGGIVASAPSMIAFWQGLLSGKLLPQSVVESQFATLYPMFGQPMFYGEGVMVYDLPVASGEAPSVWVGHSGGAPGVKAVVAYALREKAFVAVALTGDGSAEATAALLLKQLQ